MLAFYFTTFAQVSSLQTFQGGILTYKEILFNSLWPNFSRFLLLQAQIQKLPANFICNCWVISGGVLHFFIFIQKRSVDIDHNLFLSLVTNVWGSLCFGRSITENFWFRQCLPIKLKNLVVGILKRELHKDGLKCIVCSADLIGNKYLHWVWRSVPLLSQKLVRCKFNYRWS